LLGACLIALLVVPAWASAATSGGATPTPPPGPPPPAPRPLLTDVRCVSNPSGGCIERHRVENGGTLRLRGRNMAATQSVVFYGARGRGDDVTAPVNSTGSRFANAVVPDNARSGAVGALTGSGPRSARWTGLVVEAANAQLSPYGLTGMPVPVEASVSQPHRIFYGGMHKSVFRYQIKGPQRMDAQVNLVRQKDGVVVRAWPQTGIPPGETQKIVWDGSVGGKNLPEGRYFFQVTAPGASSSRSVTQTASAEDAIDLFNFAYPIAGRVTWYGDGLGAGRSHKGQDVFAKCGTPMVAARGGKVIFSGYHGAAGNYIVIDGKGTDLDMAYMHLRKPALASEGDSVYTGQPIGEVGDTGNATGCHLHFEIWSAPGWYKGGHPLEPLPYLKSWARSQNARAPTRKGHAHRGSHRR
jgi:hypothetical protein